MKQELNIVIMILGLLSHEQSSCVGISSGLQDFEWQRYSWQIRCDY